MKFAAPILLAAARGDRTDKKKLGGGGVIRDFWEADHGHVEDCSNDECDEVCREGFFATSMKRRAAYVGASLLDKSCSNRNKKPRVSR